jgi:hypothetical protein
MYPRRISFKKYDLYTRTQVITQMERNHPCNSYYPFCKLCPKETFREAMKNNIWNDSNIGKTFEEMNMNIHDSDDWEYIDYLEFYSRKEFMKVRENVKYRLRVTWLPQYMI